MRQNRQQLAFTLIELLVVVAIITVLAGILIPVTQSALIRARQASGAEQMRQVGIALQCYALDHKQFYPPVAVAEVPWDRQALDAYLAVYSEEGRPVFDGGGNAYSRGGEDVRRAYSAGGAMFGVTSWGQAIHSSKSRAILSIQNPGEAVLLFDGLVTWRGMCRDGTDWSRFLQDVQRESTEGNSYIDYRHGGVAHFFFADMHVEALTPAQVTTKFKNSRVYGGL